MQLDKGKKMSSKTHCTAGRVHTNSPVREDRKYKDTEVIQHL